MTSLVTVYIPEFYWRRFLSLHMYSQNWARTTQIAQLLPMQKRRTHPSNALSSFFFSIDFLKRPLFFSWSAVPFWQRLFIPFRREIHRSKFPPVTLWHLTNWRVSYIWRHSWNSICQSFFPAWISNMIQIHSGEISRPQDLIHPSLGPWATS